MYVYVYVHVNECRCPWSRHLIPEVGIYPLSHLQPLNLCVYVHVCVQSTCKGKACHVYPECGDQITTL